MKTAAGTQHTLLPCPAAVEHVFDMHTRKSNPQLSLYNSEEEAVLNEQNPLPSQLYLPSQEPAQSQVDRPVREDISGARVAQQNDEELQADEMEFNASNTAKGKKKVTRRGPMDEMRQLVR